MKVENETITWGIIGCGNVTEKKSGPAFNKIEHSKLVAVMRRDAAKAEDYAQRHGVPRWYDDANKLISDPEINAIYIATPPSSHEEYTRQALQAGKYVYVEKPVTTSVASCKRMIEAAEVYKGKLCVAHYRRGLPYFNEIKKTLNKGVIGKVKMVRLAIFQPHKNTLIPKTDSYWRVVPEVSGGGLFFDLAPHQLDILIWMLGDPVSYCGKAVNQARLYEAEDTVSGTMQFPDDVLFTGNWCFTMPEFLQEDSCEIVGEKGSIKFPVFGNQYTLQNKEGVQRFDFIHPENIQQPMIQKVVDFFLDKGDNPCSANEALKSMCVMEAFLQGK